MAGTKMSSDGAERTVTLWRRMSGSAFQILATHCVITAWYCVVTVEYCSSDTLVIACREPEAVIIVERALYGRMTAGKCITSTYGESMGCRADVRAQLDDRCSGRHNCTMLVAVFDSMIQPCPRDFKSYLEIRYECVRGTPLVVEDTCRC